MAGDCDGQNKKIEFICQHGVSWSGSQTNEHEAISNAGPAGRAGARIGQTLT